MKVMIMRKSGKRLYLSDRKAALFQRMGIAYEDLAVVVKAPIRKAPVMEAAPTEPDFEPESEPEPQKPRRRRRYKRRDMDAEDNPCSEDSNAFSNFSV